MNTLSRIGRKPGGTLPRMRLPRMRWHVGVCLLVGLLFGGSSALAQQSLPAFEVASVRLVVTKATASDLLSGRRRVGMLVSEARVDIPEMSLSELVRRAFRLPPYQISTPEWLDKVLVEIQATLPLINVNRCLRCSGIC